jgi:2-polyprenyl-3-methyl-5-hydroxy-6-metoxy-1,4-benzoquinol methylase
MSQNTSSNNPPHAFSHGRTVDSFDSREVASNYPAEYGQKFRERKERSCILKALEHVAPNSSILDLPCGTGRLTRILVEAGLEVTGADSSGHMVELARSNWQNYQTHNSQFDSKNVTFDVRDVMDTKYADGQFDAVICNRLFHHFNESQTRIQALEELQRICNGPLIISFFDSFALDALKRSLSYAVRGKVQTDRIPIPMRRFTDEIQQAGLEIVDTLSILRGFSPMRYVVLQSASKKTQLSAA